MSYDTKGQPSLLASVLDKSEAALENGAVPDRATCDLIVDYYVSRLTPKLRFILILSYVLCSSNASHGTITSSTPSPFTNLTMPFSTHPSQSSGPHSLPCSSSYFAWGWEICRRNEQYARGYVKMWRTGNSAAVRFGLGVSERWGRATWPE